MKTAQSPEDVIIGTHRDMDPLFSDNRRRCNPKVSSIVKSDNILGCFYDKLELESTSSNLGSDLGVTFGPKTPSKIGVKPEKWRDFLRYATPVYDSLGGGDDKDVATWEMDDSFRLTKRQRINNNKLKDWISNAADAEETQHLNLYNAVKLIESPKQADLEELIDSMKDFLDGHIANFKIWNQTLSHREKISLNGYPIQPSEVLGLVEKLAVELEAKVVYGSLLGEKAMDNLHVMGNQSTAFLTGIDLNTFEVSYLIVTPVFEKKPCGVEIDWIGHFPLGRRTEEAQHTNPSIKYDDPTSLSIKMRFSAYLDLSALPGIDYERLSDSNYFQFHLNSDKISLKWFSRRFCQYRDFESNKLYCDFDLMDRRLDDDKILSGGDRQCALDLLRDKKKEPEWRCDIDYIRENNRLQQFGEHSDYGFMAYTNDTIIGITHKEVFETLTTQDGKVRCLLVSGEKYRGVLFNSSNWGGSTHSKWNIEEARQSNDDHLDADAVSKILIYTIIMSSPGWMCLSLLIDLFVYIHDTDYDFKSLNEMYTTKMVKKVVDSWMLQYFPLSTLKGPIEFVLGVLQVLLLYLIVILTFMIVMLGYVVDLWHKISKLILIFAKTFIKILIGLVIHSLLFVARVCVWIIEKIIWQLIPAIYDGIFRISSCLWSLAVALISFASSICTWVNSFSEEPSKRKPEEVLKEWGNSRKRMWTKTKTRQKVYSKGKNATQLNDVEGKSSNEVKSEKKGNEKGQIDDKKSKLNEAKDQKTPTKQARHPSPRKKSLVIPPEYHSTASPTTSSTSQTPPDSGKSSPLIVDEDAFRLVGEFTNAEYDSREKSSGILQDDEDAVDKRVGEGPRSRSLSEDSGISDPSSLKTSEIQSMDDEFSMVVFAQCRVCKKVEMEPHTFLTCVRESFIIDAR